MDGILILMFLAQVGRDEAKARMKELESELARAEQTSALREEVFNYSIQMANDYVKSALFTQNPPNYRFQLACGLALRR